MKRFYSQGNLSLSYQIGLFPTRSCKTASSQEFISQPVVNDDKLTGTRSAIAVQQKSITGGGDNTVKGLEQEVTNVVGKDKDMEAGAKTATSVEKEVAGDLGEKEVLVASKNDRQIPESDYWWKREHCYRWK
jgi:hypothetical protein